MDAEPSSSKNSFSCEKSHSPHNNDNALVIDDKAFEEEEVTEVNESQMLHLQKVSSMVDEAYRRVELYNREAELYKSASAAVSERSSCASTHQPALSLPESLDGGQAEVEELQALPPTIDSALKMNQALQRRFNSTLLRLQSTLKDNQNRQSELKDKLEEMRLMFRTEASAKDLKERYRLKTSVFTIPYFKDRYMAPAPMNEDTKLKVHSGYIDLYSTKLRTWVTSERKLLLERVQSEYKDTAMKRCRHRIKHAERILKDESLSQEEKEATESELDVCKSNFEILASATPDKLEFEQGIPIDWDKISAQAFDGHRTPEECRLQWENYVKPSINSKQFSEEEDIMIQKMIQEDGNKKHKWDAIAKNLGSGRTSFQVFSRWASFIHPALNPAQWSDEDSKRLVDAVNMLRVGNHIPWTLVARHLSGFTANQVLSRWRVLNPDMTKGAFTKEEDFNLIRGVYMFGLNFETIANFLPSRSRDQVKERIRRSLLPGLTHKPWTLKEDRKIIKYCHMDFYNWRTLALEVPTRKPSDLKMRYYTLHFWQDISDTKTMPPPLFPLSQTRKEEEIKLLKSQIYKNSSTLKPFLDRVDARAGIKKKVNIFDIKRHETSKRQSSEKIKKLLNSASDKPRTPFKVKDRRGAQKGSKSPTWPDMALTEYFLPHRAPPSKELADPLADSLLSYIHLSQGLLLSVGRKTLPYERKELRHFGLVDEDFALYDYLSEENELSSLYTHGGNPCPDVMPLLPPSSTTVGALVSLLVHVPKLKEMATKDFLLYNISKKQLTILGKQPNTLNTGQTFDDYKSTVESKFIEKMEPQISAKLMDNKVESCNKDAEHKGSRRSAAKKAEIFNRVFIEADDKFDGVQSNDDSSSTFTKPTAKQLHSMMMAAKVPSIRSMKHQNDEVIETTMEKSDKVLFHRFMSLFLLPAILTTKKPPEKCKLISQKILDKYSEETAIEDVDNVPESELPSLVQSNLKATFPTKSGTLCPGLTSSELGKLISELKIRMSGPRRVGKITETLPSEIFRANLTSSSDVLDLLKPNFRCSKKTLVTLRRSMITRKLWEDRKAGLKPHKKRRGCAKVSKRPTMEATRKSSRRKRRNVYFEENFTMDDDDDGDQEEMPQE